MKLESRLTADGRVAILELAGRFDVYEAEVVRSWFFNQFPDGPCQVVANLAGVTFIDSTGLAVLVDGLKRCRQRDGNLHLCRLGKTVRIIFELTRLDTAFAIFSEEAAAISAYS
jgi:anti-sigma B factor antagonist